DSNPKLPPERLPSDLIQLAFLLFVFLLGVPSNVITLIRLLRLQKTTRKNSSRASFVRLKVQLTLSDLMLLFFFVAPRIVWIATYQWIFGDLLCKFYNYISMASFYLSSNIIVCIAIDRLRTVLNALQIGKGTHTVAPVLNLIVPAWLLSFTWAAPQMAVFQTTNILANSSRTWIQCSDIWAISSHQPAAISMPSWFLTIRSQFAYEVTHLLLVFWMPLLVLLISHGTIAALISQVSSLKQQACAYSINITLL
ncbi:hypothetical protein PMAYCL1PPCAC_16357, partial [Pristionchus mayeri]